MKGIVIPDELVEAFIQAWNEHKDTYRSISSAHHINMGWCYQFALVMRKVYGKSCQIYQDFNGCHCWVKIGNRFYDSTHRSGVLDIEDIQMGADGEPVTIKTCISYWNKIGGSGKVRLDVIRDTVKRFRANSTASK